MSERLLSNVYTSLLHYTYITKYKRYYCIGYSTRNKNEPRVRQYIVKYGKKLSAGLQLKLLLFYPRCNPLLLRYPILFLRYQFTYLASTNNLHIML